MACRQPLPACKRTPGFCNSFKTAAAGLSGRTIPFQGFALAFQDFAVVFKHFTWGIIILQSLKNKVQWAAEFQLPAGEL